MRKTKKNGFEYVDSETGEELHGKYENFGLRAWIPGADEFVYYFYGKEVSEEEYRKNELIEQLAGIE